MHADTGCLQLISGGTAAILTSAGWGWYRNVGSLFLIGILIALLLGAGGKLLLHWRRKMYPNQAVELSRSAYDELLVNLEQHSLLNADQKAVLLAEQGKLTLPWYIRTAFAFGGWIAALILLALLILLGFVSGMFDNLNAGTIIVVSLIGGAFAAFLLTRPGMGYSRLVWYGQ